VKQEKNTRTVLEKVTEEIESYKDQESIPLANNPLHWWRDHQYKYLVLSSYARELLCIPATSVPSERVFSTAGDIVSSQRAAISAENVDIQLFLKKNMTIP
jgi:hypothetical protein